MEMVGRDVSVWWGSAWKDFYMPPLKGLDLVLFDVHSF